MLRILDLDDEHRTGSIHFLREDRDVGASRLVDRQFDGFDGSAVLEVKHENACLGRRRDGDGERFCSGLDLNADTAPESHGFDQIQVRTVDGDLGSGRGRILAEAGHGRLHKRISHGDGLAILHMEDGIAGLGSLGNGQDDLALVGEFDARRIRQVDAGHQVDVFTGDRQFSAVLDG